jgi:hypothetical protein
MNRYQIEANEIVARLEVLHKRVAKFSAHPTLHTRVAGVKAEIAELEIRLPKMEATARWTEELYGRG